MSLLVVAALSVLPANALETTDTVALQEVTVSAAKGSALFFDEPLAYSKLGEREIDQLNLVSVKRISDLIPNFFVPDYGSRITSTIYVRGIGARMDQPAVGLNVDNVPIINKDAYDFDMADIFSVEMLRGPQSMLYGRNTMGGVINITTLSPLRYQGLRIAAGYSSGNSFRISAGYYHRFSPDMGISASVAWNSSSGFFRNEYSGKKLDHEKNISGRLKYDWRISPSLTLQNTASIAGLRQGGYPYQSLESGSIAFNDTCFYRRFTFNDGLTIVWKPASFTLTSISSVQHINDNMTLDQDFTPLDYFTLTQKKNEWALTQDVVVRSVDNGSWYSWLAGAFGFLKHNRMPAPVTFKDTGISSLIENHRNDANPEYPIRWDSRQFTLGSEFVLPVYGLALYHQSSFDFSRWHLQAGLRLDYEHSSLDYHSFCDTGYEIYHADLSDGSLSPYRHVDVKIDDRGHLSQSFLQLLPKLALLYDIETGQDAKNVYFNFTKGYKSGGYNTQMFSDVLQQRLMGIMGISAQYDIDEVVSYRPEKSWNLEIGSHLVFLQGKLDLQTALFCIFCRDQQLTMFPPGTTTGRIMTNAGRTRSLGAEISASYRPVNSLLLNLSYGFTDARFTRYFNGREDFSGNHIPYAPMNTLFLQGCYSFRFSNKAVKEVSVGVNMRGTGKIYWNDENSQVQDFYILPGAFVRVSGKKWDAELYGENLSGTRFNTFYFLSMGNGFVQRGKPRVLGVSLRFDI